MTWSHPMVRMHIGVRLEMCSLVLLTSSWRNACPPQLGLQSIEIQGRAAEIGKQMAEEGCEGETQTQHHEEESHL